MNASLSNQQNISQNHLRSWTACTSDKTFKFKCQAEITQKSKKIALVFFNLYLAKKYSKIYKNLNGRKENG